MGILRTPHHARHLWRQWVVAWQHLQNWDADPTSEEIAAFVALYRQLTRRGVRFAPAVTSFVHLACDPRQADRLDDGVEDATASDGP
jgi:hypothetical protein